MDIAEGARRVLGRELSPEARGQLGKYLNLLVKWSSAQRLTGSADPAWIVEHLLVDSLFFVPLLPADPSRVADLGSGAGIPGVPVKIVRPDLDVTLIEARRKRVSFLTAVVRELGMSGLRVLEGRAESIGEGGYDIVVARCAGAAESVIPLARRLLRPGGRLVITAPPGGRQAKQDQVRIVTSADGRSRRRFLELLA